MLESPIPCQCILSKLQAQAAEIKGLRQLCSRLEVEKDDMGLRLSQREEQLEEHKLRREITEIELDQHKDALAEKARTLDETNNLLRAQEILLHYPLGMERDLCVKEQEERPIDACNSPS
ncbi:hypothetical protein PG985_005543 [Apiospora marii]|uniref:uncharacterized protein n=1 Tax=Apiospora marii TaxID=335849 RepID=UPI0031307B10